MKQKLLFLATLFAIAFVANAQTLFVPNGSTGIGSSVNGNVGIGTTSLAYKLVIQGNSAGANAGTLSLITLSANSGEISSLSLAGTFVNNSDKGTRKVADIIGGFASGAWGTEYLSFNVGNNGSANDTWNVTSEKMRILNNGNVGIGTTSPQTKLDVVGASSSTGGSDGILVSNTNSGSTNKAGFVVTGKTFNWGGVGANNTFLFAAPGSPFAIATQDNNPIEFLTNYNEMGRFAPSGNFLLGTTTDNGYRLCVNGTGLFTGNLTAPNLLCSNGTLGSFSADNSYAIFQAGASSNVIGSIEVRGNWNGSANIGGYTTFNTAGTERMRITETGSIGIGTINPSKKFDVNDCSGVEIISRFIGGFLSSGNNYSSVEFGSLGDTYGKSGHIGYLTNNADLNSSGVYLVNYGDSELLASLFIKRGGNVGIGSTNPDQKLTVNGKIHAQEVIVDLNVPADYVFAKDYTLMPLQKVEQYVQQNSHLPEIPSAAEVKQQGLSVGEMQNKLLQKVEELTLYAIQQQKEIKELKEEVKQLKSK